VDRSKVKGKIQHINAMKADRGRQKRYSSTNSGSQNYAKIYFTMILNIKYANRGTKGLLLSGTALCP